MLLPAFGLSNVKNTVKRYFCGKIACYMKRLLTTVLFLLLLAVACKETVITRKPADVPTITGLPAENRKTALTQPEVVALAEAFVRAQGYTDFIPDFTKIKVQFERMEYASTPQDVLKYRHNLLRPKAVGVRQYDNKKWLVGFAYYWEEENIARAVTMDSIGAIITMQLQDVRIDWVQGLED
ncbi:hypothetical protein C7N43_27830 [Sphingobacteriales bacterium UPWRP_1]|nr:hypothetical protein BVG80_07820 [Sphingobacteriales bacterium TSM_CSM]PSJ73706.1 hypothetical protein C7N43_27830 [Sphingobacteriales bacterium UPWRP_1]